MRKRVINHVADTIFWYILYFLPVLAYLCFVISAPLRDNFITEEPFYEERTICTIPAGVPFELEPGASSFNSQGVLVGGFSVSLADFTSFSMPFFSTYNPPPPLGSTPLFISNVVYIDTATFSLFAPYSFEIPEGAIFETLYILEDSSNMRAFSFDVSYLEYHTELILIGFAPQNVYDFKDFVNSMGFEFATDNIIVNSLADIFGTGGIMPMFDNDTPFIIFAWFIGVYLLHLLVDFLLFIPRIAHKWMKDCTGGD